MLPPPLTERITRLSPNLDIYIIPDQNSRPYRAGARGSNRRILNTADLIKSVSVLAAATLICCIFDCLGLSEANIITIYILGVLVTAVITRHRIYSLTSSVICVLLFNFLFTEPRFTLNAYDPGYLATFPIMLIAAFLTSSLAVKIQRQARQAAETAYRRVQQADCKQLWERTQRLLHRSSIFAPELQNPPKGYLLCRPQGRRDEEILCDECGNGSCRI